MADKRNSPRPSSKAKGLVASDKERTKTSVPTISTSERNEVEVSVFRVDHTPPPLLISEGSIIVETDRDFDARDTGGGTGHRNRHKFNGNRKTLGLKILDDAGDTIYLNGNAENCSVKIWWKNPGGTEQIFVDGSNFTVETDEELSASVSTGHASPKRMKRHTHPNAQANELKQVQVIKNGNTIFFEDRRVAQVMIWDTRD
jgi:hypothetical protein